MKEVPEILKFTYLKELNLYYFLINLSALQILPIYLIKSLLV